MSKERAVELLEDYVAIPSVNPMGRDDLEASIIGESRLAQHVAGQLRALGVEVALVGEAPRQSVVAEVRAGAGAETIAVASHLDTVPVDGMEIPPFTPTIRAGRLYGRGACDTKAGMAALVAALERVLGRGGLRRNLVLVGEADEELSSTGARDVLGALGTRRPDWLIATEPTGLAVVHSHKGVVHARLEARGRACHASAPAAGRNALVALSRAALALDDLARRLAERFDPTLGPATLSIGLMQGGHAPNIVPDRAWLVADRRLLPGETLAGCRAEIEAALAAAGVADDVELVALSLEKPSLGTRADHACVLACQRALRAAALPATSGGVAFGTDAGIFAEAGIPAVVMGPGSIEQAHTASEYVEIAQVEAMVEVFVRLLRGD